MATSSAVTSSEIVSMDFTQPEHATARAYYDEKAVRISNLIDEELKKDFARRKDASRREIRAMLLGQAESGKSTLQKQFQLYYASQTLDRERPSWQPVVYFNVLKAVRMTLDELDYEFSRLKEDPTTSSVTSPTNSGESASEKLETWRREIGELRVQLVPLIAIEDTLASELSGGISVAGGRTGAFVRAGWQALVPSTFPLSDSHSRPPTRTGKGRTLEVVLLAARTLAATVGPIKVLWCHPAVKRLLQSRKLRLDESAPFFLNSIDRIAEPGYLPSNEDILNVRVQTLGVMEHTFPIDMGGTTYHWKIYDVGGARGQKYFTFYKATRMGSLLRRRHGDNISCADKRLRPGKSFAELSLRHHALFSHHRLSSSFPIQYLEEDPKTNRIDDSLQLFNAVCSNKLLIRAHLVLLLNKADLLKKKLTAGTKVRK
ncbi:hypothetical protein DXG03_001207 [Asterophora parasitica]|uniref:Uncharacterized protein n=1 Tax=Asterophora parasitica TaxID=117018 RepID=A0A9P7G733_9AGAR|nr:hypothetical protein DXG03_001207 [Asterophora parasitica]